ncbi:MAG: helix-hairpin-helix domain-containing protein [Chlorobiales bacterium]|nr:helix-hairpin-helix domain-containing protein [Chlorobiales bacterium]
MSKLFNCLKRHAIPVGMTFFLFFTLLFSPFPALCAENNALQQLLDSAESEINLEQLLELIESLKSNSISLNEADADELRQLPWLTTFDAQTILSYRRDKGPILSLDELEPIIGKEKTASIAPFVRFKNSQVPQKIPSARSDQSKLMLYSRLFWETPERKGILNGAYSGENYKLYQRLQFSAPHVAVNLVQEKDIGESDIADFTSMSIYAYDLGVIKSAVVGNYRLNFGEGLLIGQNRYFSKGVDPTASVRLSSKHLSPFTSSSEYGFFQGAATTLKLDSFEVTSFYSANHVDAIINKTSGLITSFDESGNHRTQLELSRKDNVIETVSGAHLFYQYQTGLVNGRVGGTVLYYHYSEPLNKLAPYSPAGNQSSSALYSIEADGSFGKASFFAEAAFSEKPNDASWTVGAEYEIFNGVSTIASLRRYGDHYFSPFAGAFAERGSGASNEDGDYVGVKAKVSDRLSIGAYYDLFTFPLLDDHCQYPSEGNDFRMFMLWKQSPVINWNLQLQHKYKEEQSNQGTASNPLWTVLPQISSRSRLDCDVDLNQSVHVRTRGEVKKVVKQYLSGDSPFYGWMMYQQAGYHSGKFSLKGRFTLFNTDDYDAALYAYEDDLPLTSSLGLYNGHGKSFFILASWQAMQQMKLAAKYEISWFSDREAYSSGNDERATSNPGSFHLGCSLLF